jgi:hypothetical protein
MNRTIILFLLVFSSGCASLWDSPKNIVGVSVRDLQEMRVESLYQAYPAEYSDVFSAVLDVAKDEKYHVFSKSQDRGLIVLMNIPGCVDTTEVGVFLTRLGDREIKVELSSRSTPAKRAVAQRLFIDLEKRFPKT